MKTMLLIQEIVARADADAELPEELVSPQVRWKPLKNPSDYGLLLSRSGEARCCHKLP